VDKFGDMDYKQRLMAAYEDGVKTGRESCSYKMLGKVNEILNLLIKECGGDKDDV
jgi:hypothetical protein